MPAAGIRGSPRGSGPRNPHLDRARSCTQRGGSTMTLRVGVIGVGAIGQDHIRRLTHVISGSRVVALSDVDNQRAQSAAKSLEGARVHVMGEDLIEDGEVDAILVTSWGPTHEEYVLASLAAGKPVFCAKPLAPTADASLRIRQAVHGRRRLLGHVGCMR